MRSWTAFLLGSGLYIIACLVIEIPSPSTAPAGRGRAPASSQPVELTHASSVPSAADTRGSFDAFFQSESADPAWSQRTTELLTRSIQAVLPAGSSLQLLECRETLCRIETTHADLEEFHAYARDAFFNPETRVTAEGVFATLLGSPTPGEPVVSVAFLAREGTELPSIEARLAAR